MKKEEINAKKGDSSSYEVGAKTSASSCWMMGIFFLGLKRKAHHPRGATFAHKNNSENVGAGLVSTQQNKSQNRVGVACCAIQGHHTTMRLHRGITIISLVITIIILLILAGVTINLVIGNEGILKLAETAKENYENSAEKEEAELARVNEYIANGRETVVISKEEYEQLKPKSIKQDSLILSSTNSSYSMQNINLNSFTNTFSDNFEQYFSYDSDTGELTCKKSGWYMVNWDIAVTHATSQWSIVYFYLYINNVDISHGRVQAFSEVWSEWDSNNVTIFINSGDIVKFNEVVSETSPQYGAGANIRIFKL